MTTTPPSESSSSPTEAAQSELEAEHAPSAGALFAKGCGCSLMVILLAVGIALVGGREPASWGSALFGAVILLVIVGTSGLVGWWNK